jgi:hypothetical protein
MLNALIDHNPDLKRLHDEGYSLEISGSHLLVHEIPFANAANEVKRGTIVTTLTLAGDSTVKPDNHVAYFIGDAPCNVNGTPLNIIISSGKVTLGNVIGDHTLSAKADYQDYYEKIARYNNILSAPAENFDETITAKTFQVVEPSEEDSVFHYADTNSTRAHINPITDKLKEQKIAIIGLGGTGSYVLDLIAKTPVREIHLFDEDPFLNHNAFRAPGATPKERFYEHLQKTEYFKEIYANMHKAIFSHPYNISKDNVHELADMTCVFICMDSGPVKKDIFSFLDEKQIIFINTGLSLEEIDGSLKGQVRVTTSTPEKREHVWDRVSLNDAKDNIYDQNIQVADLNSLNATLAVIKWKKLLGFYKDLDREFYTSYVIYFNETINDDLPA